MMDLLYLVLLAVRAVLSWFPPQRSGSAIAQISNVIFEVTEPLLAPLRRVIPPAGMFDLSFLVLFLVISVVRSAIC